MREYRPNDETNPGHYRIEGRKECIDEIRIELGDEGFIAFCCGNAMKYRYRAGLKSGEGIQGLYKARWYEEMAMHVKLPERHRDPRDK